MIDGARPEVELVCRCLDPSPGAASRERTETLLATGLDWEFLFEFAQHHGVVPLVHRRLAGDYTAHLDDRIQSRLDAMQRSRTARNLRMTTVLHEILDRFEAEQVRALPIKGPVLAATAHGSLSRRTFNDLDLLVRESDLSRALDVLEAMGYERGIDAPRLDDAAILGGPVTPPLANEYTLQHPDEDVVVEIRRQGGADAVAFEPTFDAFWDRRTSTTVAGRTVPALSPADRLLFLTYHGVKHGWGLLKWVSDVAETVHANPDLDWTELFQRAQAHETARRLAVGLGVTETVVDTTVPEVATRLESDSVARDLVAQVHDRLVEQPLCELDAIDTVSYRLSASESDPGRLSSWAFTWQLHPTLAEYRLAPLPGSLHLVYYLLRPVRLALVFGISRPVSDGFSVGPSFLTAIRP